MAKKKDDDEQTPEDTITVRALKDCFMANRRQQPGDVFVVPASKFREDLMEVVDEKDAAKAERAEETANEARVAEDRAHAGRVMSDPVTGHPRPKDEEPDRRKK